MRAAALLLALCASSRWPAAAAEEAADTLDVAQWAVRTAALGGPHPREQYVLPRGVKRHSRAADEYFTRWLQCSTMVEWCTPAEVECGCDAQGCDESSTLRRCLG
jgi:hypothetical protein